MYSRCRQITPNGQPGKQRILRLQMVSLKVLFASVILGLATASRSGPPVKWCVTDDEDECLCSHLKFAGCPRMKTAMECAELVAAGHATIVNLKIYEIIQAGRQLDLQAMMTIRNEESLVYGNDSSVGFYIVIVAKKKDSNKHFTLDKLESMKACHPAINRTSGWSMIVGLLVSRGIIDADRSTSHDELERKVRNFFGESCLPGALSGSKSCSICKGNCEADAREPYFGYSGTMQCLSEVGDVAFVRSTDVPQSGQYELLCPDGGSAPVGEYERCHVAIAPSRIVAATKKTLEKFGAHLARRLGSSTKPLVYPAHCSAPTRKVYYNVAKSAKYDEFLKPSYLQLMKLFA